MLFWTVAIAMTLLTAAAIVLPLWRGRSGDAPSAAYDLEVYRAQLAEVDNDLARGIVTEEEATRVRTEVSRRILDADKKLQAAQALGDAPRQMSRIAMGLTAAVIVFGAVLVYRQLGAPGYPDFPLQARLQDAKDRRADRPAQADMVVPRPVPENLPDGYADLVERLKLAVAQRPNDPDGQRMLVNHAVNINDYPTAYAAQERLIELLGAEASAEDYVALADLMIVGANGYVSPEAETALLEVLKRDNDNEVALFYTGLMYSQNDRADLTFQIWKALLEKGAPDAPWQAAVRAQIDEIAWRAGAKDYTPPPLPATPPAAGLPGPSADDIEAAGEMTPEERAEMINNMVMQLESRLASEGGTAQEWARLIGVLVVQGNRDHAAEILGEARQVFAGRDEDLAVINKAATDAGL